MSPISWLQWFPAFERSQKGIAECHNLIMYFWVSLHVLRLLEIFHSHYDLALCLSPVSLFCFTLSFLFLSLSFQFLPLFSFAHLSTALSVMSLIRSPPPFYPSVPFYTSPSLLHCSDSFFLCFTLFRGQVVEQLAYYIHVSETVITEETF